ncbi:MAG: methionyl-tRNA formyltransferase [Deltaproteobacteria bacterium]|nr:methionyl-tRNA formyltransferase [Deltaproteobacteria bacterium]MBW2362527.1 methionyl-tRNA formyltransferase [Deltaproteobacteria bacterium]
MSLRIAFFGQAAFGKDVYERLVEQGHEMVGVYTPPEGKRPDPLAEAARARGDTLVQAKRFRRKRGEAFEPIPELLAEYEALGAELNVLAFVTAILPSEIVDRPAQGSLCFHPSLLPKFRGGNALAWQIIEGETESGVTVFRPDAGVDTGPIVVQKGGVAIESRDTAGSLYFQKLYPLGVEALAEAVNAIASGTAGFVAQDETRASHQGLVSDADARIDWARPAAELDRLARGCDPQPGAWAECGGEILRLYDVVLEPGGSDAAPGSLLGFADGAARIAASGGCLRVGRLKLGAAGKLAAAEAGLVPGERLR